MPLPAGFVEEEVLTASQPNISETMPAGFVSENKTIPEISQAPEKGIFDKMINFFKDDDKLIARSQNIYALSKVTGLPLREVNKNYELLSKSSRVTGISPDIDDKEYMQMLLLPAVAVGAVTNPLGTAAGLIAFGTLDRVIPTDKLVKNMQERGVKDEVVSMVELADFIGKAMIVGGVFKKAPKVAEGFFKNKITEYKMPETVTLNATQVRDIFQTGKLTTPEQQSLFGSLELNSYDTRATLEHGININIPAEKVITLIDKPFWAKIKGMFGIAPTSEAVSLPIGEPTKGVAGLIGQQEYKFKPLENMSGKTFYHGTAKISDVLQARPDVYGKYGLYGEGLYLTDNPNVAESYAQATGGKLGKVVTGQIKNANLIDLEKPLPDEVYALFEKAIKGYEGELPKTKIGKDVWDALNNAARDTEDWGGTVETYQFLSEDLSAMGYDGFKHIGGEKIGGFGNHNVAIIFPQKIKSVFQKTPIDLTKSQLTKKFQSIQPSGNPIQKVISALKEAKDLRAEQETLYTKARSQKFAKMQAVGAKVKGEKGYYAQLGALKGELPKVEFEAIRNKVGQEDIDALFNMVKESPKIGEWEKLSAYQGLSKIFGEEGGKVPTKNEIALLNEVFGKEFTEAILEKRSLFEKMKEAGYQLANIPRSLMASFDLSAPLRQGVFLVGRPKQWGPAFVKMFPAFAGEKGYQNIQDAIITHSDYQLSRDSGLALTDMDVLLGTREEQFMSSWAEKIPLIGRGVRASERAYIGFLNKLRFDIFADMVNKAEAIGLNPRKDRDLTKAIADFINNATGRGTLPYGLQKAAVALNTAFFSPRLIMSRLNLLNPIYYIRQKPFVRKEMLKSLFGFLGIGLTTLTLAKLMGAEVGDEPRSSDFGKIKIGSTRIDVWGGFQPLVRASSQIITGKYVSSTTGKEMTLGEGYRPLTRADIAWRFLEGKLAPVPSFVVTLMKQQDIMGEPVNVPKEIALRFIPMVMQDLYDLAQENPGLLPAWVLSLFGVGMQTYEEATYR